MMRRVAITGIGLVTPLGVGRERTWKNLCASRSGIAQMEIGGRTWCVGVVHRETETAMPHRDRSIAFALLAAEEAVLDSQLDFSSLAGDRVGVVMGASKGGIHTFAAQHARFLADGRLESGSTLLDDYPVAAPTEAVAERFNVSGPAIAVSSACAAGAHAIIEATNLIREGRADVVLAGGTEASLHPLVLACYENMGVLAVANGNPAACCKPFDLHRTGFAPAEGAGVVVLEEVEQAHRRAARIYASVSAGVRAADACHLTRLREDGASIARAIALALRQASLRPLDIDYVNAHGTGTRQNDAVETRALKTALGDAAPRVPISSTKGALGHLLGAAGSVEASLCALAMRDGFLPPTLNLETRDPECDLDYLPMRGRGAEVRHAMSLSFGFGGQIGVIVLSKDASQSGKESWL